MSWSPSLSLTPFSFNAPPTTEIYTLSLHDALPIFARLCCGRLAGGRSHLAVAPRRRSTVDCREQRAFAEIGFAAKARDRKSTRLNSSHSQISYAVFCLKKKKKEMKRYITHPFRRQS